MKKLILFVLLFVLLIPITNQFDSGVPYTSDLMPQGESRLQHRILAGEPYTYSITTENYSIYEVEITTLTDLRNVRLTINLLDGKPKAIVPNPRGIEYKYLEIVWSGLSEEHIADARIRFKISRDWLESNNYGDKHALLWRWDGGAWSNLTTYQKEEDYWYRYYEARTLWFSTFVITLTDIKYEEPVEEVTVVKEEEVEPEEQVQEPATPISPRSAVTGLAPAVVEHGVTIDPILVLLLFAFVGAVLLYFNVIVKIRESKDLT